MATINLTIASRASIATIGEISIIPIGGIIRLKSPRYGSQIRLKTLSMSYKTPDFCGIQLSSTYTTIKTEYKSTSLMRILSSINVLQKSFSSCSLNFVSTDAIAYSQSKSVISNGLYRALKSTCYAKSEIKETFRKSCGALLHR